MTRRTWFRTITTSLATLATGLGLRKVEKKNVPNPDYVDAPEPKKVLFFAVRCNGEEGFEWEEMPMPDFPNGPPKWLTYDLKKK